MKKYVTNEEFDDKILELQKRVNNLYIKLDKEYHNKNIYEERVMKEMDNYKYRLSQKTPWGIIDHYFHEDREEQLIKLIKYCNENNIEYELNDKAKEFHNKLYNMILKGE